MPEVLLLSLAENGAGDMGTTNKVDLALFYLIIKHPRYSSLL